MCPDHSLPFARRRQKVRRKLDRKQRHLELVAREAQDLAQPSRQSRGGTDLLRVRKEDLGLGGA